MRKLSGIHTWKSTVDKLKQFMIEGETYDLAINRLLDLEEAENTIGFVEEEFAINYQDVERLFKVRFNKSGLDEMYFNNSFTKTWDTSADAWLVDVSLEEKNIVRYLVNFIDKFRSINKNFVMLEMMGNSVEYDGVTIRRI